MYMTTADILSLARDAQQYRSFLKRYDLHDWLKHHNMMAQLRKGMTKAWRKRLTLSSNAFPRKACYPYGEQAMQPKATGQDVWAHVGKRG